MHDVQQQCVQYPSDRDMGEGVSSEEEYMDAWDLLGMLNLKGGKTAQSFVLRRLAFCMLKSPGAWVLNSQCWLPLFRVWGAWCVRVCRQFAPVGFKCVILGGRYGLYARA
jgi:hypothetical protein